MPHARRYDLVAIDLDGTMLDSEGRVPEENIRALNAAREAGVRVVVCTGRGLVECAHVLRRIAHDDPAVVAGGSLLACPLSGRTLHRFALPPGLVAAGAERLLGHGYPVMVLKDPWAAGYDYLMVRGEANHPIDPVTAWWFENLGVKVRHAAGIADDEHPGHTVRFGVCGFATDLESVAADMHAGFADLLTMHHFPAVCSAEHAANHAGRSFHILEIFHREASKWSAVAWLARQLGIPQERTAAIGDQINDLPLIRGAGLGIAMANAVPSVKAAAARETRGNDEAGVAHALRNILDGTW